MRSGGESDPAPHRPMSATMLLLIVNGVVFLAQAVFYGYPPDFSKGPPLALQVDELLHGYVWQLLTFQFLHGGLMHLLLNCWGIYVFGRDVESALGRRRFFILYFTSGVVGGLLQVLFSLGWHGHFGGSVVGASAGLFGLIAAFATMYPHRVLTLLLFFVIPVSLKAKTLLLVSGAIALFGILFPGDSVAHAAHLGGMLAGLVFIRQLRFRWGFWPGEQPHPQPKAPGRSRIIEVEEVDVDQRMSRQVDAILDKINAKGIHSLTERERQTLDEARKKMGRR